MASDTDICNIALSYLGANAIADLTDGTPEGNICQLHYPLARDATLEEANWSFAIERKVYGSPDDPGPDFEYSKSFLLDEKVIRVISVNGGLDDWAIEKNRILTDAGRIEVKFIAQITDPEQFSPSFVSALAARIAAEIALPLTSSPAHMERMVQMYTAKINRAKANDGRQGRNKVRTNNRRFKR